MRTDGKEQELIKRNKNWTKHETCRARYQVWKLKYLHYNIGVLKRTT